MAEEEDCGCGGKKTRREFLQTTAVVGVGLATAAMLTGSAQPAEAAGGIGICEDLRSACFNACNQQTDLYHKIKCKANCLVEYAACMAQQLLQMIQNALQQAIAWLKAHPGVVIGTIILIGVIAFIVVTGGAGAPIAVLV